MGVSATSRVSQVSSGELTVGDPVGVGESDGVGRHTIRLMSRRRTPDSLIPVFCWLEWGWGTGES